eukprot:524951-Amphidinium_carterae.1
MSQFSQKHFPLVPLRACPLFFHGHVEVAEGNYIQLVIPSLATLFVVSCLELFGSKKCMDSIFAKRLLLLFWWDYFNHFRGVPTVSAKNYYMSNSAKLKVQAFIRDGSKYRYYSIVLSTPNMKVLFFSELIAETNHIW